MKDILLEPQRLAWRWLLMFDENGNLILPKDAFINVPVPRKIRVKCPYCGHIIQAQTLRNFTVCKRCHTEVRLR